MKKLFAVAIVTALSGFVSMLVVVGCAADSAPDPGVAPDASIDVRPDRRPPGPEPEEDADPPAPTGCLATQAIDATNFAYSPAAVSPGACTAEEAKALADYFAAKVNANEDVVISEWAKEVSTSCSECVFSDGTGAEWTPILVKNDHLLGLNRGGCVELMTGKPECGEAYQQVTECRYAACSACESDEAMTECVQDGEAIFTGPCKDAYDKVIAACGDALDAAETACRGKDWQFEGPIQAQCVTGGAPDGD